MATSTRSLVLRATGLVFRKAGEVVSFLTAVINQHLSSSELSQLKYTVSAIPSCDDETQSAALVDFKNGIPLFLNRLIEHPLEECPVETDDGDINFDRHFFGFTQLNFPDPARPVDVDIVAITGLGGHAYGSWRGKEPLCRMWLRDFLSKDLPTCRTMIYGYNSNLLSQGVDTIMTYGLEFLEGIKRVRTTQELRQRPIIFIAHSFGGIILAHALIKARQGHPDDHSDLAALYEATYGILFFAVPHKGMVIDDIQSMIAGTENRPRNNLLQQINRNSDLLTSQLVDFKNLIRDRKIVSFFETEQTRRLKWDPNTQSWGRTGSYITAVDMESSILQLPSQMESPIPLHSDHSQIVKFDSRNALGYKFALEKLKEFVRLSSEVVSKRFSHFVSENISEGNTEGLSKFLVPFDRDLKFVGREDIIQEVSSRFETQRRVALWGIGGIGKSQVAIQYCYIWRGQHRQGHVFWAHVSTQDRFDQAYKGIARELSIPGWENPKVDTTVIVRDWLNKHENGPWLLVLDNADDLDLFFGTPSQDSSLPSPQIADLLPRSPNGSIFITTRDKRVGRRLTDSGEVIMIKPLAPPEAAQLLRNKITKADNLIEKNIQTLMEILCFIPLAITQAAAFIEENSMTVTAYIEELSKSDSDLQDYLNEDLPDPRRDSASENSVIRTWKLSFDHIAKEIPRAAELLSLMAMLDRQAIPLTLLRQDSDRSIDINKALGTLQAFSLITTETGGSYFEIHRLVQLATRRWLLLQGQQDEWQEKALQLVAEKFPSGEHETWQACEVILPHAKAVTRYEIKSEAMLLQWADLVHKMAIYDDRQGRFDVSYQEWKEVLQIRIEVLGQKHPDTLASISNLAIVLHSQGKYAEAESMLREALQLLKEVLGQKHPDTLTSISNLALTLDSQGKHTEAESMHREALQLLKEVLGQKHPNTLTSISNLALVLRKQGKYTEAESMLREVLQLLKEIQGEKHPNTLGSINNLALALNSQGKHTEAESMHREALQLLKEIQGEKHPNTLGSINNLALALDSQGKYAEAESMLREVLQLRKEVLREKHPDTLININNLALVLDSQGKYAEAESMYREALQLKNKMLGQKHPSTLTSISNLALALSSQGKHIEAESMFRKVLQLRKEVLGQKHPNTLTSINNLALVLRRQGKYDEAGLKDQEALQLRKEVQESLT